MNKIKIYNKKNRLSTSLNLIFGIYSFYKYEGKNVHELMCTKNDMLSYKITSFKESVLFEISRDTLLIKKEFGSKKEEYTYNNKKETLRKKTTIEVEPKKFLKIDDYKNEYKITKRDICFNFNKKKLNEIKNGKSKN